MRKREKEGERKEGRDEMILSGRVRGVRERERAEAQEGDPVFETNSCLSLRLSGVRAFLPCRSHRVSGF